jgi:hypothetical protein
MKRSLLLSALLLIVAVGVVAAQNAAAEAAGSCLLSTRDLPIFVVDEVGNLVLTDFQADDFDSFTKLEPVPVVMVVTKEPCNGGTNTCGGSSKSCPNSGGPKCKDAEVCKCLCDASDGAVYNGCTEKPE